MTLYTYTFYYRRSDLINFTSPQNTNYTNIVYDPSANGFKKIQQTILYNDPSCNTPAAISRNGPSYASAVYDITVLNIKNLSYDFENTFFQIDSSGNPYGQTGFIKFTIALLDNSVAGYFSSGNFNVKIDGGTGDFLKATGTVNFDINNETLLRTVKLYINIP